MGEELGHEFSMKGRDENLEFELIVKSNTAKSTFFSSYAFAEFLTHLIERADTSGWMKHENEMQPTFYASIINAIGRLSYFDYDGEIPENMTPYTWLTTLLSSLQDEGLLDKELPKSNEDDEEFDD